MTIPAVYHGRCVHAGVLQELYAKLEAIVPKTPWPRTRYTSRARCPDCHRRLALTVSKDQQESGRPR